MGHDTAHNGDVLIVGQARAGEVEGLKEAKAAARAHDGKPCEVENGSTWVNHRRKTGGVGRYHDILGKAALQAKTGHAEIGILIRELNVPGVVGGLRDAPGQSKRPSVSLLTLHNQAAGLLQQATGGRAHDQGRHKIFEHRP